MATAVAVPAEFRSWDFIGQAWQLVKPQWLTLGLMFVIITLLSPVMFIIGGPIFIGVNRTVLAIIAGQTPTVGMLFSGFDRFLQGFLANLVIAILVSIGMMFCIVPGVILTIMWMFTLTIMAETNLDFWPAMQASADLTSGYRWSLFCLMLANVVIIVLGVLACGVGIFIAQPVAFMSVALAYRFLQSRKGQKLAVV